MTEPKIADLYTGIHAHRDALVRAAGDASQLAARLRDAGASLPSSSRYNGVKALLSASARDLEQLSMELASGLERLSRLADGCMDDTAVLGLQDVADAVDDPPPRK